MECNFDIEKTLGNVSKNGVGSISGADQDRYSEEDFTNICNLIDRIGKLSAIVSNFN